MQQREILTSVIGMVLLLSGVVSHIMKMHTMGAVIMIIGLAYTSFALYSTLESSRKLERVEQPFRSNVREHY